MEKSGNIFIPKEPPSISLSEVFHENTKIYPGTAQWTNPMPRFSTTQIQEMSRAYKQYPLAQKQDLPALDKLNRNPVPFDEVIEKRRTVRNFNSDGMALNNLSKILHQTYGITGEIPLEGGGIQNLRAVPSGGALYPAEIYLGVNNIEGLEAGVYHYNVKDHQLEILKKGNFSETLLNICIDQPYAKTANTVVFISAVMERTKQKYGERGYRYILLDIGHLAQNLYLACSALNLAVMTTCGFYDDEANKFLHLDGLRESVLYVAFIGNKSQ